MKTWIDFKVLRANLDFDKILRHYGVEVKRKGSNHNGYCPLPNHNGKKNSVSFSANLEKGIFQCFGCGAKGNLLDFEVLMENADPKDGSALRKVAGEMKKEFGSGLWDAAPNEKKTALPPRKLKPKSELPAAVNTPLDFELKGWTTIIRI